MHPCPSFLSVVAEQIFGRFDFEARFMINLRPACSLSLTIWHRLKVSMEGCAIFGTQGRTLYRSVGCRGRRIGHMHGA